MKGKHEQGKKVLRKINGKVPGYDIETQCEHARSHYDQG